MSDEPIRLPDQEPAKTPTGIFEHWCEHPGCVKWGSWGYSRFRDMPPRWFCWEHRDDGEMLIA